MHLPKTQHFAFTRTERCGQGSHLTFSFLELNFPQFGKASHLTFTFNPFERKVWVLLKYWHCVIEEDSAIFPLSGFSRGR